MTDEQREWKGISWMLTSGTGKCNGTKLRKNNIGTKYQIVSQKPSKVSLAGNFQMKNEKPYQTKHLKLERVKHLKINYIVNNCALAGS